MMRRRGEQKPWEIVWLVSGSGGDGFEKKKDSSGRGDSAGKGRVVVKVVAEAAAAKEVGNIWRCGGIKKRDSGWRGCSEKRPQGKIPNRGPLKAKILKHVCPMGAYTHGGARGSDYDTSPPKPKLGGGGGDTSLLM